MNELLTSAPATAGLLMLAGVAATLDLRTRRIPNWLTGVGLALGLGLRLPLGPDAVGDGMLGAGLALALAVPSFLAGGLGGGDAKLLTAFGAFLGPRSLLVSLAFTGLIGGVMAVGHTLRRREGGEIVGRTLRFARHCLRPGRPGELPAGADAAGIPYGIAIALGSTIGWFLA